MQRTIKGFLVGNFTHLQMCHHQVSRRKSFTHAENYLTMNPMERRVHSSFMPKKFTSRSVRLNNSAVLANVSGNAKTTFSNDHADINFVGQFKKFSIFEVDMSDFRIDLTSSKKVFLCPVCALVLTSDC